MSSTGHDTHLYDPDRHDNQIVAVFEDRPAAERAAAALAAAGVPGGAVSIIDQPPGEDRKPDDSIGEQVLDAFMGLFTSHHDKDYAHAVHHGHAMLVLTPPAGADRHALIEAIDTAGPIDFDRKLEEWRQAGYGSDNTPATTPAPEERRQGQPETMDRPTRVRSYLADRA